MTSKIPRAIVRIFASFFLFVFMLLFFLSLTMASITSPDVARNTIGDVLSSVSETGESQSFTDMGAQAAVMCDTQTQVMFPLELDDEEHVVTIPCSEIKAGNPEEVFKTEITDLFFEKFYNKEYDCGSVPKCAQVGEMNVLLSARAHSFFVALQSLSVIGILFFVLLLALASNSWLMVLRRVARSLVMATLFPVISPFIFKGGSGFSRSLTAPIMDALQTKLFPLLMGSAVLLLVVTILRYYATRGKIKDQIPKQAQIPMLVVTLAVGAYFAWKLFVFHAGFL